MRRLIPGPLAFSLLLIWATATPAGYIVQNGGFELPVFDHEYITVFAGQNTLPGWTVGGTSIDVIYGPLFNPIYVFDGNNSVDLAGTPGPGSIFQILPTVANGSYKLSFALSSNGGPFVNGLQVYWDGSLLDTVTSPRLGTWEILTYNVTALSDSTLLEFYTPITNSNGPLLDDVSVTAVSPAPSTLTILAIGLASLAAYGWRRRLPGGLICR
jgi:Protein of unknown function (DUF642)